MKRLFLIPALLFAGMLPLGAEAATLALSPSSSSFAPGNTFAADIILDTAQAAIDGVDVSLNYSYTLLKAIDSDVAKDGIQVLPGTLLPITTANRVSPFGSVSFSQVTASDTTFTGSGVLATILFQAIAPGSATVTFNFTSGRTTDANVSSGGVDLLDAVTNASFSIIENGQPPVISNPRVIPRPSFFVTSTTTVDVKIATNEKGGCRYSLAPNTDFSLMSKVFSPSFPDCTEHSTRLSFAPPIDTVYVRCMDVAGNINPTDFAIPLTGLDTEPPAVTRPRPEGTFFQPRNIHISVLPTDQSGVSACRFSRTPNVSYDAMTRSLFPHRFFPFAFTEDAVFSILISGSELALGQNSFFVKCKDNIGNANTTDTVVSFTLLTPPKFVVGVEGSTRPDFYTFTISLFETGTTTQATSIKARPTSQGEIVLAIDNTFKNTLVGPGVYDVTVSADRYLRRKLTGIELSAGITVAVPTLLAGDLNSDGIINSIDWSIMEKQWGSFFGTADINRDGRVNTLDWGYLGKNWLQRSE